MGLTKLFTAGRFSMWELLALAASDSPNREDHVKLVFEWYQTRASTLARSTLAAAAAVPAAFIVGLLKGEAKIDVAVAVVGAIVTAVLAAAALWQNLHLSHLHREHILCIWLLHELEDFHEDLERHLRATGGRVV